MGKKHIFIVALKYAKGIDEAPILYISGQVFLPGSVDNANQELKKRKNPPATCTQLIRLPSRKAFSA